MRRKSAAEVAEDIYAIKHALFRIEKRLDIYEKRAAVNHERVKHLRTVLYSFIGAVGAAILGFVAKWWR